MLSSLRRVGVTWAVAVAMLAMVASLPVTQASASAGVPVTQASASAAVPVTPGSGSAAVPQAAAWPAVPGTSASAAPTTVMGYEVEQVSVEAVQGMMGRSEHEDIPLRDRSDLAFACPEQMPTGLFGDASDGVFGRDVDCLAWYGITQGIASGVFEPAGEVTRAQMAVFVSRLLAHTLALYDQPLPEWDGQSRFPDVPDSAQAAEAINVLSSAEAEALLGRQIVAGGSDGRFRPADPVTREQMATFLSRSLFGIVHVIDQLTEDELSIVRGECAPPFGDIGAVSATHRDNVEFVCEAGVTTGRQDGTFGPRDNVTRGQMAAFLMRTQDWLVEFGLSLPPDDDPGDDPGDPDTPGDESEVESFAVTADGIEGGPPAAELVGWMVDWLGTADEDTGWFLDDCTGDVFLRWVSWGTFTIALERDGSEVRFLAARFALDAPPPPGPQLPEGFTPGMTWGEAQERGAVLEPFYGYYEIAGELLFGNVSDTAWPPRDSDLLIDVIIGLPGGFYLAGC